MLLFILNFLLISLYVYTVYKTGLIENITYRHIGIIEEVYKFGFFLLIYYTNKNKSDIKNYLTSAVQFSIIETILRIGYGEGVGIMLFLLPIKTAIHILFILPTLVAWRVNKKLVPIALLIGGLIHGAWDILCINNNFISSVLGIIITLFIYSLIYNYNYYDNRISYD